MKIKDLIAKMSNWTEIFIYSDETACKMSTDGDCTPGDPLDSKADECEYCIYYIPDTYESAKYHGTADGCPIKLAELTVKEINNAYHRVQLTKRKTEMRQMIAIRVSED